MDAMPDAGWLAALRTEQGNIGNVDGRFPLDHAELSIDVARTPLMFFDQVDAGNDDTIALGVTLARPAAFAPLCAHYALDFTFISAVVARKHTNLVAFSDVHVPSPLQHFRRQ
jgi:hypothetical protein